MSRWILHHYGLSPYAEKARLLLGFKGASWRSVAVSPLPPRPGLQPVFGAFRRIPVLQRGADYFVDTRLMAEVLDSVTPSPPLFPTHARAVSMLIANWAEPRAFVMMGPVRFESRDDVQPLLEAGIHPGDFLRDRAPFMAPAVDTRRSGSVRGSARDHVLIYLAVLDDLLRAGGQYLCGNQPTAADFSAYHTLWWLRQPPQRDAVLQRVPALCAWADRMAAIGHGRSEPMTPDEALHEARAAQGEAPWRPDWPTVEDERIGQAMTLTADDYGRDPMAGTVSAMSDRHVTLTREAPGVGTVRVHFPKVGYELGAASA
ncbi:MAG TPA: glutathione S-transferase family protein [Burkholderiaceae bacterium]|nr:glutathione S-transferase family protein [Burkholderiaceae bacterium]